CAEHGFLMCSLIVDVARLGSEVISLQAGQPKYSRQNQIFVAALRGNFARRQTALEYGAGDSIRANLFTDDEVAERSLVAARLGAEPEFGGRDRVGLLDIFT